MSKKLFNQTNLRIIFGITLIAVMGVSSITPAFPEIQKALDVSAENIGLLITIFTVPGVVLTPVLGVLADRWGRKRILVPSLFLFGLAGSACFFATDFTVLLILRFFQGMGAASLGALNLTLVGDLYEGKERSAAMGYNSSVLSIGTASYPAIGGALALIGWNYPFALSIFAIPMGLAVLYFLKNPEPENGMKLKQYLGNTWQTIKQVKVFVLFTVSIITFIILYGSFLTFFPFLSNQNFDASSFEIGVLMTSMSVSMGLVSSQMEKLNKYFSERQLMMMAYALYPVALVLIPLMDGLWLLLVPTLIFGIAQGMNIPSFMSLLTSIAPLEHRAGFMSINGMVLRGGQTLGPIAMGFIYNSMGLGAVFYSGAVLAILMLILIFLFLNKHRPV